MGLAVSGGPDSLALLVLANAAFTGRVEVATVNHGIRAESAAECALVAEICGGLSIPVTLLEVSLRNGNLQAEARTARYDALSDWASDRSLNAIATAHHADDQAETVLMRLNRGSGLSGLTGIRPLRQLDGSDCAVIRPLLGWRKSQLEQIVEAAGLQPVRDPSNFDDRFDRARLRQNSADVPWLDAESIARSARHLREIEDDILLRCNAEILANVSVMGDCTHYRPQESRYVRKRVVKILLERRGEEVSLAKIEGLLERLAAAGRGNVAGLDVRIEGDRWVFKPENPRKVGR